MLNLIGDALRNREFMNTALNAYKQPKQTEEGSFGFGNAPGQLFGRGGLFHALLDPVVDVTANKIINPAAALVQSTGGTLADLLKGSSLTDALANPANAIEAQSPLLTGKFGMNEMDIGGNAFNEYMQDPVMSGLKGGATALSYAVPGKLPTGSLFSGVGNSLLRGGLNLGTQGAVGGALSGFGQSESGKELESALQGGVLGGGIGFGMGAGGAALGNLFNRAQGAKAARALPSEDKLSASDKLIDALLNPAAQPVDELGLPTLKGNRLQQIGKRAKLENLGFNMQPNSNYYSEFINSANTLDDAAKAIGVNLDQKGQQAVKNALREAQKRVVNNSDWQGTTLDDIVAKTTDNLKSKLGSKLSDSDARKMVYDFVQDRFGPETLDIAGAANLSPAAQRELMEQSARFATTGGGTTTINPAALADLRTSIGAQARKAKDQLFSGTGNPSDMALTNAALYDTLGSMLGTNVPAYQQINRTWAPILERTGDMVAAANQGGRVSNQGVLSPMNFAARKGLSAFGTIAEGLGDIMAGQNPLANTAIARSAGNATQPVTNALASMGNLVQNPEILQAIQSASPLVATALAGQQAANAPLGSGSMMPEPTQPEPVIDPAQLALQGGPAGSVGRQMGATQGGIAGQLAGGGDARSLIQNTMQSLPEQDRSALSTMLALRNQGVNVGLDDVQQAMQTPSFFDMKFDNYGDAVAEILRRAPNADMKSIMSVLNMIAPDIEGRQKQVAAPRQGKQLSTGALDKLAEAQSTLGVFDQLADIINQNEGQFNPADLGNKVRDMGGILSDPAREGIKSQIGLLTSEILRQFSGVGASDRERQQIQSLLPSTNDKPDVAISKLNKVKSMFASKLNNKLGAYQQGGYDVGEIAAALQN